VLWKLYEKFPAMQKEYGEIQPLLLHTSSSNLLVSKKPVKTLEDIKGMEAARAGRPAHRDGQGAGRRADADSDARRVPIPRQGRGRRRRRTMGGDSRLPAYEVAKNYTEAPFYGAISRSAPTRRNGSRCQRDVRDQIMSVSGLAGREVLGQEFFDTARLAHSSGPRPATTRSPLLGPADEVERWRQGRRRAALEEWIKKMEGKGHKDARDVLNSAISMLKN